MEHTYKNLKLSHSLMLIIMVAVACTPLSSGSSPYSVQATGQKFSEITSPSVIVTSCFRKQSSQTQLFLLQKHFCFCNYEYSLHKAVTRRSLYKNVHRKAIKMVLKGDIALTDTLSVNRTACVRDGLRLMMALLAETCNKTL